MAAYKIGEFEFDIWRGDVPQLVGQLITSHTRSGSDGTGQQMLGKWGATFEAQLENWVGGGIAAANFLAAKRLVRRYQALRGLGPQKVIYENIDYLEVFQHKYSVDFVAEVSCQTKTLLVTDQNSFPGGAVLITSFRLTPHLQTDIEES